MSEGRKRTAVEVLEEIRDRLTLGQVTPDKWTTARDGVELPLVMATIPGDDPRHVFNMGPNFQEVWKQDMHHYTSGELLVTVDERKPAGVLIYAAEVQVVGFIAGVPDVLSTAAVNAASGPMIVPIVRPFDYLRVAARQLVNGVPDVSLALGVGHLDLAVQTRLQR